MAVYEQDDGNVTGFCFVCEKYFPDPDNNNTRGENFMGKLNLQEIGKLPMDAIPNRGIDKETAQLYQVRTEYDGATREPTAYYFPVYRKGRLVGYKKRGAQDKTFTTIGDCKNPIDFFGQEQLGGRGKMVVLTEGEIDAMSAYQMFKRLGKSYRFWSLPQGANVRTVRERIEDLEKFETIILALDQDEPGQKCASEISELLSPGKVRIMSFSEKDANDMMRMGKEKEFYRALNNAKEVKPDGIVTVEDIIDEASKPVEWGLSWPWPSLTNVTYGIRRKELYGFGGGTGAGKTEGFKEVIEHLLVEHDKPVGLIFLEENPSMTLKVIAGKIDNKMYHVPDGNWSVDELRKTVEKLKDKMYLYNHFGQKNWTTIKSKIRYMVAGLGIKDIFLDHLTALVADEENVNKALENIMADMAALTQELDFTLYYVSHLTTPMGTPHEEGGRVTASQFRGSRTIAYWTHFLFGYERNQQAENPEDRNRVRLRVLKDRYTGMSTGTVVPLQYNRATGRFLEEREEF
jgi:twinkle protein